jgi:hypothetical protein
MALLRKFKCRKCGKEKQELQSVRDISNICNACRLEEEKSLTLEERVARIERQLNLNTPIG